MATAPRSHTAHLARAGLAAVCGVVLGCGGGDDAPSDERQIQSAVERLLESERIVDQCETGVSPRFVREVYGTLVRCREANRPNPDASDPDTARTSAVRIDGERASVGVTLTSVKGSRATGRLALVRHDGAWKVDRLGVDFLRSIFATLPNEADTAEQRLVLGCFAEAARAMSSADVRSFGNLMVGKKLSDESMPPAVLECIQRGQSESTTA